MIVPIDHRAVEVTFSRKALCVELSDGRMICAPLDWFPAVECAHIPQRDDWQIADDGNVLWWPDLRERVSVPFLLSLRGGLSVAAQPRVPEESAT